MLGLGWAEGFEAMAACGLFAVAFEVDIRGTAGKVVDIDGWLSDTIDGPQRLPLLLGAASLLSLCLPPPRPPPRWPVQGQPSPAMELRLQDA
jgi:hypothetical protein